MYTTAEAGADFFTLDFSLFDLTSAFRPVTTKTLGIVRRIAKDLLLTKTTGDNGEGQCKQQGYEPEFLQRASCYGEHRGLICLKEVGAKRRGVHIYSDGAFAFIFKQDIP